MKKLIFLLLFLPTVTFSQNSWVNFKVQYDFYGVQESNWFMVADSTGDTSIFHQPTTPYQFLDTTINLQSGNYTITLTDSYGDGWTSVSPAWFKMQNTCQGLIIDWQLQGVPFFLRDTTVNVMPCAPPAGGCLDPLATNYDSTAAWDDSSCIYPPCSGLDTLWGETYCVGANVKTHYHWTNMANPSCRMLAISKSDSPYNLGNNWYPYPSNWSNQGIIYSNQQPNTTYYFLGLLADSSYTDTVIVTTGECNVGCTNPAALNYNPWANVDDGSCQMPPANCASGQSNIVVTVIPDTYPGETSWEITDANGTVLAGDSNFTQTGVPVITETCIPNGTVIQFTAYDSFGDGLCGSCYGGVDGSILVQTLCGDTLLYLGGTPASANFGTDTTTVPYTVAPCSANIIPGCMDPGYTEYNPQATVNDSSCATPVVLGCTDITSPDYNPLANTMEIVPNCDYTLIITDGASDGWFGSWIGLLQDTTILGPYTMGPNDGASNSYTINLSSFSPVEAMFFAPGNASTTANQCGFYLIGPEGDTTLSGGTNSWTNPMLQFPYRYHGVPYCGNYCTPGVVGCMDSTALNYNPLANMPDVCTPIILGCTNPLAFNYNTQANVDDSTCVPIIIGCMDSTAFNFNSSANTNDQQSCIPVILGCMDDTMFNYNPAANTDDGSCVAIVYGCTDINAFNYDSLANTNNGSCIPVIYGCTDSTAFNFQPSANTDNGSCIPVIIGCTDQAALNYDSTANTNNGCIYPIYGCTNPAMFNFNINANTDDGSCVPYIYGCTDSTAFNYCDSCNTNVGCIYPVLGCTDPNMFNYNPLANTDDSSCAPFIYGCTDAMMWNYNPNANTDNGSCLPYIYGCTDSTQYNYNPLANTDNGTCIPYIYGCTDSTAFNYNQLANADNNTCIPILYGCTDSTALNYNALANTDDGTCIPILYGCTDSTAMNYNSLANTDDGSCIPYIYGCIDSTAFNYDPWANTDDGSCIPYIYGCTDPAMFNYDPLANTDDSSCVPFIYGCTDPIMFNYDPAANTDNGSCVQFIYGCIDSTMFNYDPTANTDNGTCIPFIYGCTDNTAYNFNPLANTLDNSCCYIGGCTDSTALNYDPNACWDDGSCITPVIGCTDVSAYNYNPAANVTDSTACLYDAGCYGGPGIPYWLNDGCYAWVIDVDDYCCTTSWDPTCQQMYDYCQLGWPTGIEDLTETQILIYPNPTTGIVNIRARGNIDVDIYDMLGNHIADFQSLQKEIDLSSCKPGIYNLRITYKDRVINYRVIKQ